MSASDPFSDISANVLNSTEGAHLKNMSTFETDEHLRELTPLPSAEVESASGQPEVKCGRLRYMLRGSVLVRATKALTMLKRILAGVVLIVMLLAGMYFAGKGVPQNDAEAVKWYRLAAEQGHAQAQFNLGVKYAKGEGVPQDDTEAVKWFRLAAQQGDARAQFALGVMYGKGQGVPQDYAEAARWFRLAAEQGDAKAQWNLGTYYAEGDGVPQDYVLAHMWFNLAASRLSASEAEGAVKGRDLIASQMTPAQIAEAQKLAREWKPK